MGGLSCSSGQFLLSVSASPAPGIMVERHRWGSGAASEDIQEPMRSYVYNSIEDGKEKCWLVS